MGGWIDMANVYLQCGWCGEVHLHACEELNKLERDRYCKLRGDKEIALEVALKEFELLQEHKLTSRNYANVIVLIKRALDGEG